MKALENCLILILFSFSNFAYAEVLNTPSYVISIERNCAEGYVTCDDVTYIGESKKSTNRITLKGKTIHTTCADGITPCKFLGYFFKNGNVTYRVLESGKLQVIQGKNKVIIEEQGTWSY